MVLNTGNKIFSDDFVNDSGNVAYTGQFGTDVVRDEDVIRIYKSGVGGATDKEYTVPDGKAAYIVGVNVSARVATAGLIILEIWDQDGDSNPVWARRLTTGAIGDTVDFSPGVAYKMTRGHISASSTQSAEISIFGWETKG